MTRNLPLKAGGGEILIPNLKISLSARNDCQRGISRSFATKGHRNFILSEDECLCQGIVNKALKKKGCGLHYHPPAFLLCPEMCNLLNHAEKN
ncbi:hypothetical protein [Candidatus Kuenenia sp.]|uniref:hypothetical protein n=1 Tax=Candidatus Kuenenia sp. TaxID=2499824 RepID=UPI00321F9EBB